MEALARAFDLEKPDISVSLADLVTRAPISRSD